MIAYDDAGVVVRAYTVDHSPVSPALGYRIEFEGRAIGITGDTVLTPGLEALAAGVDVLVADVMDRAVTLDTACALERIGDERNAQILRDMGTYHVDVAEVAQPSADAGVGTLMATHQVPSLPEDQAKQLFEPQIAQIFDGVVVVAVDGSRVTINI